MLASAASKRLSAPADIVFQQRHDGYLNAAISAVSPPRGSLLGTFIALQQRLSGQMASRLTASPSCRGRILVRTRRICAYDFTGAFNLPSSSVQDLTLLSRILHVWEVSNKMVAERLSVVLSVQSPRGDHLLHFLQGKRAQEKYVCPLVKEEHIKRFSKVFFSPIKCLAASWKVAARAYWHLMPTVCLFTSSMLPCRSAMVGSVNRKRQTLNFLPIKGSQIIFQFCDLSLELGSAELKGQACSQFFRNF